MQAEPDSGFRPNGKSSDVPMFRAMKPDVDGLPLVGRSGRMLGVRVNDSYRDIPVAEDGTVSPGTGGMSVALDDAVNLPKPRLPRSLGGEGRDPVFRMQSEFLPEELQARADHYPHACVEPSERCALSDFEMSLADTRDDWSRLP